ncbi:hypothetical protein GQ44DRAFT_742540 [Phaeosphaeriaceae sp. PMI808]|nr:hypothetical protein GQ44DRAFT_742540 [Phaeosphaeriaceae sp. PMI808]
MTINGPILPAPIAEVPITSVVDKPLVDIKIEESTKEKPLPFDPIALNEKCRTYIVLDGSLSHLKDPWVNPGFRCDAIEEGIDVVIVGGGYGAQVVAVRLIEVGVNSFRVIEKAEDFGGTWYWNRYLGAQCDIKSYIYMPLLEEVNYMPTEKYAHETELLKHSRCGWMHWMEEEARDDKIKSRFVIPAAGPLHRPKLLGVQCIEGFKGHSFHSPRWDFDYTGGDPSGNLHRLKDKRVGIIGTGATAVQIVPHLGEWAKQLYKERMGNFANITNGGLKHGGMDADRWTDLIHELTASHQLADFKKMESVRTRVDNILVDTKGQGVERITEKGVIANGEEHEINCLIYATRFELANNCRHFPNCFWVFIVQATLTPNVMCITSEQARHFAYVISECRKRNIRTVELTQEAGKSCDFYKGCTSGYYNNEGKPSKTAARNTTYAFGSQAFVKILTGWRSANGLAGLDVM